MINSIFKFFSGGGVKSIENIATEWIETDKEKAEAQTVMLKALDPNGIMRRELSRKVSTLYTVYVITALMLLICESFGLGNAKSIALATEKVTELFTPITTLFGVIVSASFGVNYANTKNVK